MFFLNMQEKYVLFKLWQQLFFFFLNPFRNKNIFSVTSRRGRSQPKYVMPHLQYMFEKHSSILPHADGQEHATRWENVSKFIRALLSPEHQHHKCRRTFCLWLKGSKCFQDRKQNKIISHPCFWLDTGCKTASPCSSYWDSTRLAKQTHQYKHVYNHFYSFFF